MKFAVVIPNCNDSEGLWFTVAGALQDIEQDFAPGDFEIIAVVDGPEDDATRVILSMRQQKMCRIINVDTRTPQKNRHVGLLATEAPYVFFLDSHIVPSRGFFKRMLESAQETGAALTHAGHCFWRTSGTAYGYTMAWKDYFWSVSAESTPQKKDGPYRICLAGHGAICVDRAQYLEIGGYWDALEGWGGEEPQLNLKAWMMGKMVMMEPRVYHWHYMPLKRDMCGIQMSERYARNFMLVAYAVGGQKYLDSVYFCFTQMHNGHKTLEEAMAAKPVAPHKGIYEAIPAVAAAERAQVCSGPYGGDLDKLRQFFEVANIPN